MRLKKLEIQGFKSFAEKTEIFFDQGTTAIVGPNGSGKSNISDAMRWVLGEQSAKQLRGARMEDIIFGGTEKRKPHSWAEVSLLFDNEDRALSMDCAEVLVTRRVWRSGESEYYLNKASCRLKDITNLFRDTGIGKEGYSLIGQGRIDEILSTKSDDRREVFEEAAGIVTYRARKNEAERRMDNTRQNLDRVEDILSELEDQLEPLKQQAEDAKRFIALRESLRDLELNAFVINHDRLKKNIEKNQELIQLIDQEIENATPKVAALHESREEMNEKLDAIDAEDRTLSAVVLEAARALESQEGTNNVFRERITSAENAIRREETLAEEAHSRAESLETLRVDNESEEKALRETLEAAQAELSEKEEALRVAQAESIRREEALEAHKAAIIGSMNRMSDMKSTRARLRALEQNLGARLVETEAQESTFATEREALSISHKEAQDRLHAEQAALAQMDGEAKKLDELVRQSAQESESLLQGLRERTGRRHEVSSRLKVLREMERDYEGYQNAVRQALMHARGDKSVRGVVANVLSTPKDYERALEMVLGSALQQIITEDEQAAKRMIEYLRRNRFGRATFLPMSTVRGRTLGQHERGVLTLKGCMGVASELVRFDSEYRGIVESLLGRTIIADTLDNGIQIMRQGRQAFRLVTLEGDVMHSGGSMTGGSVQSRMTSLLSREREITEHETLLSRLNDEIETIQGRVAALDTGRNEAKRERNSLYDRAHQAEIAVAREMAHEKQAREQLEAHDNRVSQMRQQATQIRENLNEIEEELRRAEADQEGGELDQESMQARTVQMQQALYDIRDQVDALREEETRIRIRVTSAERQLEAVCKEAERLLSEEGRLTSQKEHRDVDRRAQEMTLERDREALAHGEAELVDKQAKLESARHEQTACAERRRAMLAEHRELTAELESLRKTLSDSEDKKHKTELSLVRNEGELKNLQERIWNDYELTYAGALEFRREDFALQESQRQITAIRAEIREMGSVNVNAVEDYITKQQRFEELNTQKQDLLKATTDLENIINELLVKMEKRFRTRFRELNTYFVETFQKLFGGGNAELKLGDESDILNCTIDVVAQPPGKKLQLLTLLSGGERALTAIAILFAMLQLKPTPFCVLDEIEAALDEANVANFADYLNKFSETTQFVVVTHRRGTMERCQALYGVAMEEKGVSRMVSVKLADISA